MMMHAKKPDEYDEDAIFTALSTFLEKGDLAGAEEYVLKNIRLFPKEARSEIVGILLEEALATAAEAEKGVATIQDQAMIGIEELEKLRDSLEKENGTR